MATALVTGANSGIGKEIARQLLGLGHTVYVGARDEARGRAAVDELRGASGAERVAGAGRAGGAGGVVGEVRLVVVDVADQGSIAKAVETVGQLDVLVNNAGINPGGETAREADLDTFRRVYETNVFGLVAVTNAFMPLLKQSEHPRIVNVSSGTASLEWSAGPNPQFDFQQIKGGGAVYRSSKTAVNALTVLYAQALEGFKVNALAPGRRATNLTEAMRNATPGQLRAAGVGDPAEAAVEAVRLATLPDDGPTGQFFSWDGTLVPW